MTPDQLAKSGTEHAEQRALFAWANMTAMYGVAVASLDGSYTIKDYAKNFVLGIENEPGSSCPQLKWLHSIHNQGHGDAIRGSKAKAEGVKAGVADLFLPCPVGHGYSDFVEGSHTFCGLYIEMKRADKGKLSIEQSEFIHDMTNAGYKAVVCFGWKNARDEILKYLGLV